MHLPLRRSLIAAAAASVPFVLAYRFALEYRRRAGLPYRHPVLGRPEEFGLRCEAVEIPSGDLRLPGWFLPADPIEPGSASQAGGAGGLASAGPGTSAGPVAPAVVIVHGWESNRSRVLAQARFLHAAGYHCLTFDVRGHGDAAPETLPITAAEFGADAAAAVRYVAGRPDVRGVAVLGHSMGGAAALIAGATVPGVGAVVTIAAPSDPVNLTRAAFRLAELRVPAPLDLPLAWLTARVFVSPRRHSLDDASASAAAARYRGPLLLVHGTEDRALPVTHLHRLASAARWSRTPDDGPVETLVMPGYGHRWLYESPVYRRTVAMFLTRSLGGPLPLEDAMARAAACDVRRPDDPVQGFGGMRRGRR